MVEKQPVYVPSVNALMQAWVQMRTARGTSEAVARAEFDAAIAVIRGDGDA